MVEGVGLEPTNPMGADLQSAAFGQLRYPSNILKWCRPEDLNPQPTDYKSVALPIELGRQNGGGCRARTCDPLLVRQVLSQLS